MALRRGKITETVKRSEAAWSSERRERGRKRRNRELVHRACLGK